MPEQLTLTTPIVPPALTSTVQYELVRLVVERLPVASVMVVVRANSGERIQVDYRDDVGGTAAAQLIHALNTANFSAVSLQARILNKLVTDGKLPGGVVTGIPD